VKKYRVDVWEEFEVEADSYDEAINKAWEKIEEDATTHALDIVIEEVEEESE